MFGLFAMLFEFEKDALEESRVVFGMGEFYLRLF